MCLLVVLPTTIPSTSLRRLLLVLISLLPFLAVPILSTFILLYSRTSFLKFLRLLSFGGGLRAGDKCRNFSRNKVLILLLARVPALSDAFTSFRYISSSVFAVGRGVEGLYFRMYLPRNYSRNKTL